MISSYVALLRECFNLFPVSIARTEAHQIHLDLQGLRSLQWKRQTFDPAALPSFFQSRLKGLEGLDFHGTTWKIDGTLTLKKFTAILNELDRLTTQLAEENLENAELWGMPTGIVPTGFDEKETKTPSTDLLAELYADQYLVAEKKPFVLDLLKSTGNYLVSIPPDRKSIIDGASQIASLATGINDAATSPMPLRPELWQNGWDTRQWDVQKAMESMIQRATRLPYVYWLNSGAEALESAYRACQAQYPDRRKIVAFEGSFHGRSLLSLHTTHSPDKRLPYEIFPGLVEFNPFPETKNPKAPCPEPEGWLQTWSQTEDSAFHTLLAVCQKSKETLLDREIHCLLHLRSLLKKEKRLCVAIEPLQCEGGDRYGTKRFYRALRVLTRAFETPLIMDEVQTGFGLGGPLFWHELFDLQTVDGKPDTPDVVCVAKKAQVAALATHWPQDLPNETSPASFYRGYLFARRVQQFRAEELETKLYTLMSSLQKVLDPELVQNPRGKGMAFAFDLPSKEILNELIAARFKCGLLFYPAGEKTARFRVTATTSDRELIHIFRSIYLSFQAVSDLKKIWKIPPIQDWARSLPAEWQNFALEQPKTSLSTTWKDFSIPANREAYEKFTSNDWQKIFASLVSAYPQLMRSKASLEWNLDRLAKTSKSEFWKLYESDPEMSLLDLLFQSARAFGFRIQRLKPSEVEGRIAEIMRLQGLAYDQDRIDPADRVLAATKDPQSFMLAALDPDTGSMVGFNTAAPLKLFTQVTFVEADPAIKDPHALYSMDQNVHPRWHGKGLGLRLKAEQYMECLRQGASVLRSRNKIPDSDAMAHINQKLSAVELDRRDHQYSGKGWAAYQSLTFNANNVPKEHHPPYHSPHLGSLRNKMTLSNFVGQSFVSNMTIFKDLLPKDLRHAYVASGRAESVDKLVKLLRAKRPKAHRAISIRGDFFGDTTACARSLGVTSSKLKYFDWPAVALEEVEATLAQSNLEEILGVFVEPKSEKTGLSKSPDVLQHLIETCRKHGVPVIFHETACLFHQYSPERFFCAGDALKPDGIYFHGGGQFGLLAVNKDLYLEKPLQMISTWDGDEHSMTLFRRKALASLCSKSS